MQYTISLEKYFHLILSDKYLVCKVKISIIIVNYNTTGHLKECINSVINYCSNSETELIVVDNCSTDRTIENFPEIFPNVKFIFSNHNNGFGAGCNVGANASSGDVFAFINPDTILEENVFSKLEDLLSQNSIGICGTILQDFEGNPIYSYNFFPGLHWEFLQAIGKGTNEFINDRLLNKSIIESNKPIKVDWIVGAFLVMRREVFFEIGGFDEKYFLYYEDTDLCKLASDKGYTNFILPGLRIKHFQRGSIKSIRSENIYYFNMMRSRIIFIHKHYSVVKKIMIKIMLWNGYLFRKLLLNLRTKFNEKKAIKNYQYKFTMHLLRCNYHDVLNMRYEDLIKSNEIIDLENEKMLKFTD